jgi:RsiW-degrading membrane proteinase PrsW (M82 family)
MLPGVLVAFSFYNFYKKSFIQSLGFRLGFIAFFFSLASVGLAILIEVILKKIFIHESLFVEAFFLSSLPEEISKFVFIILYFRINKIDHSLSEGIFYGILFGLFFGLVEGVFYAIDLPLWPMMVRSTTALPLHMLTSGILGSFILTYENSNPDNLPLIDLLKGFLIACFLHGMYNFSVFESLDYLYFLPPILVIGFALLEYEIMVSKNTLPREVMDIIGLNWDDYRSIFRFKQYLDWMDVDQEKFIQKEYSIIHKPKKYQIWISILCLAIGMSAGIYLIISPEMIAKSFVGIQFPEYLSIFVFYPVFISFVVGFSGTLNAEYFRSRLLRVPIFVSLNMKNQHHEEMTVVFYLTRKGFYVPLMQPNLFRSEVDLEFWIAGVLIGGVKGRVYWMDEAREENGASGALIKFSKIPWKLILFWNYALFRQRLKNIFHLPKIRIPRVLKP